MKNLRKGKHIICWNESPKGLVWYTCRSFLSARTRLKWHTEVPSSMLHLQCGWCVSQQWAFCACVMGAATLVVTKTQCAHVVAEQPYLCKLDGCPSLFALACSKILELLVSWGRMAKNPDHTNISLCVFDSFRRVSFMEVEERNKNWATSKARGTFFVQDSCGKNSLILIYRKADQDMTITLTLPGRSVVHKAIHEAQQSAQSEWTYKINVIINRETCPCEILFL